MSTAFNVVLLQTQYIVHLHLWMPVDETAPESRVELIVLVLKQQQAFN